MNLFLFFFLWIIFPFISLLPYRNTISVFIFYYQHNSSSFIKSTSYLFNFFFIYFSTFSFVSSFSSSSYLSSSSSPSFFLLYSFIFNSLFLFIHFKYFFYFALFLSAASVKSFTLRHINSQFIILHLLILLQFFCYSIFLPGMFVFYSFLVSIYFSFFVI